MSFLDQMTKELLKRYGRLALGKPFAPVFLNILATSVCDMRCVHCFFTEELDDKERKKNQMKTENIVRVSETLGGESLRAGHCRRRTVHPPRPAGYCPGVLRKQPA